MEQGSSSKSTPHFLTSRQAEKRPRIEETDELPSSYLALLTAVQNPEAQQIGTSFSRAPIFVQFENPDLNTQQINYPMLNVMFETPTPLRPMEIQSTRNSNNVPNGINLASSGSNYAQGASTSKLKRKMICQDDVAANPRSWNSFLRGDQGYSSSSYGGFWHGYSLYDERYEAHGLPVDPHLRMFNAIYGKGNGGST